MANRKSNKRTRSPFTKPRTNKQPNRAFSITEMMQLSQGEMRERVGMKCRPASLKQPAPEPTPKYNPSVLRRWRQPEPPIEIID